MPTMCREEPPPEGWYYREGEQTFGPVSDEELRQALNQGLLRLHQAVWRRGGHRLLFVRAAAVTSHGAPPAMWPPLHSLSGSPNQRRKNGIAMPCPANDSAGPNTQVQTDPHRTIL